MNPLNNKKAITLILLFSSALLFYGAQATLKAASHSDAPLIKQDPQANITDVYAFVGTRYNDPNQNVLNVIVHVRPFSGSSELSVLVMDHLEMNELGVLSLRRQVGIQHRLFGTQGSGVGSPVVESTGSHAAPLFGSLEPRRGCAVKPVT